MKKSFFVAGRTELAGNHTDHQRGRTLSTAVDMGIRAEAEPNGTSVIRIHSRGFGSFEVNTRQLTVRTQEFGQSVGMVRGVAAAFEELGLNIGGFDAEITSNLPAGAGLGSSAAFSVLIGDILSGLFNDGKLEAVVVARAGQKAENQFFGKPTGLSGQLGCAMGGTIYADFKTGQIERIEQDFASMGLTLCLTDTGGSHAGLETSYARIPADMVYIANLFDKGVLGDVDPQEFRSKGWEVSNRPVRRARHFFDENERVPLMRDALKAGDGAEYMRLMNLCGRSSERLLNNVITSATGDTKLEQGLEKSAALLDGRGAWRVQGGGFAGCVQALMPTGFFPEYKREMEKTFGEGKCMEVRVKK